MLHLLFLNIFKLLISYTCHDPMPESKQKLVKTYLKGAGLYSYDAAAEDENPVMR